MNNWKKFVPNFLKRILKNHFGQRLFGEYCYSQEGEDFVLGRIFDRQSSGFYVDVGCHHPFRFSNTYAFYARSWRGICIDPLPGVALLFKQHRPRDIVLQMGVAEVESRLSYHLFNEPALNTFDPEIAARRGNELGCRQIATQFVDCKPLGDILATHLPKDVTSIDFFSIDVEGLDLEVLRSNDWARFRPKVIVAECLGLTLQQVGSDPVSQYLNHIGYIPYAKLFHSVIYLDVSEGHNKPK